MAVLAVQIVVFFLVYASHSPQPHLSLLMLLFPISFICIFLFLVDIFSAIYTPLLYLHINSEKGKKGYEGCSC